ncbi:hypothetical protein WUBG_13856, partial [Wuchereria bancrofti]
KFLNKFQQDHHHHHQQQRQQQQHQRQQQQSLNTRFTRFHTVSEYELQGIEEGQSSLSSSSRSDQIQLSSKYAPTTVKRCSTDDSNNSISGTNQITSDATTKLIMQ